MSDDVRARAEAVVAQWDTGQSIRREYGPGIPDEVADRFDRDWRDCLTALRAALAVAPTTAQPVAVRDERLNKENADKAYIYDRVRRDLMAWRRELLGSTTDSHAMDHLIVVHHEVTKRLAALPATAQPGAVRPPGCAPDGNHASVEVVPTILLNPLDVVWHEDRWHAVIDDAANDESSVTLAPIIDDAGGQGDEVEACAEFFLRCATLPAPAVEEARQEEYAKTFGLELARSICESEPSGEVIEAQDRLKGTDAETFLVIKPSDLAEFVLCHVSNAFYDGEITLAAATHAAKESRSDDRPAKGQGGGRG